MSIEWPDDDALGHGLVGVCGPGSSDRVDRALGSSGAEALEQGSLAVAWSGIGPASMAGPWLCLIDGVLDNLGERAADLGLEPDAEPAEVIGAAWSREGNDGIARLRGDFALLLWNSAEQRGVLARDHLGARSLYLAARDGNVCFSSEIRHLLRLLPIRPAPNDVAVVHWLSDEPLRGRRTMYSGIERLGPGHLVELGAGRGRQRAYWTPRPGEPLRGTPAELAEELRSATLAAVRARMDPARPVGILLSGGFDSTTVAAAAASLRPETLRPHAYSAVFPSHHAVDESSLIARTSEQLGLQGTCLTVSGGSPLAAALSFVGAWELPLTSPNLFFMRPLMAAAARDGVAGLLDGEGGDELFGHQAYLIADRLAEGRLVAATRLARRIPTGGDLVPWRYVPRALLRFGLRPAVPAGLHLAVRRARGVRRPPRPWLSEKAIRLLYQTSDPWSWKRRSGRRWLANLEDTVIDLRDGVSGSEHLRLQARMSGTTARHPLLHDPELLGAIMSLPPESAFSAEFDRPLARQAMRGLIPDHVRLRTRKSYFDQLVRSCLTGSDLAPILRLIGSRDAEVRAYARPERLRADFLDRPPERHPRGVLGWTAEIWRLATIECWLRSQRDGGFAERLLGSGELAASEVRLSQVGA